MSKLLLRNLIISILLLSSLHLLNAQFEGQKQALEDLSDSFGLSWVIPDDGKCEEMGYFIDCCADEDIDHVCGMYVGQKDF